MYKVIYPSNSSASSSVSSSSSSSSISENAAISLPITEEDQKSQRQIGISDHVQGRECDLGKNASQKVAEDEKQTKLYWIW
ncbi:hypothetical protein MKX03_002319 [Papaver bracteatum]|nr:hypothetical protein MKX03_002319 [Papaver bracteatum]